jgi:hypothetical protein
MWRWGDGDLGKLLEEGWNVLWEGTGAGGEGREIEESCTGDTLLTCNAWRGRVSLYFTKLAKLGVFYIGKQSKHSIGLDFRITFSLGFKKFHF